MHPLMLKSIVDTCRTRIADGDCPTQPPCAVEHLEEAIVELARERDVLEHEAATMTRAKEAAIRLWGDVGADNAELLTIVRDCREPIDNLLCPTQWRTADGRTHSDLCKRIDAALARMETNE